MEQFGACKYCGQMGTVQSEKKLTKEQLNEEVTWNCRCAEAKAAREKEENYRTATAAVETLFKDMEREAEFLKQACKLLADGTLKSVTVDTGGMVKASVKTTKKGKIRITRSMSEKQEMES